MPRLASAKVIDKNKKQKHGQSPEARFNELKRALECY